MEDELSPKRALILARLRLREYYALSVDGVLVPRRRFLLNENPAAFDDARFCLHLCYEAYPGRVFYAYRLRDMLRTRAEFDVSRAVPSLQRFIQYVWSDEFGQPVTPTN